MNLADAFHDQARSNRALGSPFTARVLSLLADKLAPGTPVIDRMLAWQGDVSNRGASLPLRLLGGLHALVLTGACAPLVACYPPQDRRDDAALSAALDVALADHGETLMRWLDTPPQTNEVRRAAVMIAAARWLSARFEIADFVLSELGASAGLNLMWDKFRLDLACGVFGPRASSVRLDPDWRGPCPPSAAVPRVIDRRGVDLAPLDPHDPADALRLTSYLWPDQTHRMERARAAMALAEAKVDTGDAADWLARRLARAHPGAIHLVTHTVAWQYFPPETHQGCLDALEAAGAKARADAPLARLSMEGDARKGEGAAIELTLWPGGELVRLGRIDFHGRWVDWQARTPIKRSARMLTE